MDMVPAVLEITTVLGMMNSEWTTRGTADAASRSNADGRRVKSLQAPDNRERTRLRSPAGNSPPHHVDVKASL